MVPPTQAMPQRAAPPVEVRNVCLCCYGAGKENPGDEMQNQIVNALLCSIPSTGNFHISHSDILVSFSCIENTHSSILSERY